MTFAGRGDPTSSTGSTSGTARTPRAPRTARAGVAALAAGLALLLMPAGADAHAELESSEPASPEQLATAPTEVVLHFTEAVDLTDDTLTVLDADGARLGIGEAGHPGGEDASVTASLPDLDDGAYVVAWRVVSSDSHPIGGAFTFRVGAAGTEAGDDQALIDEGRGGAAPPGPGRPRVGAPLPQRARRGAVPRVRGGGADLTLPERDLGPITLVLVDYGQGHLSAEGAEIPLEGDWDLEVTVRTSDIDQTVFETVVPVT